MNADAMDERAIRQAIRTHLATFSHPPRAYVQSFGCQLNVRDGETYRGILADLGYAMVDDPTQADVLLLNTCAVRAHAESRVLGRLGAWKAHAQRNPDCIIGLCGCMGEEAEVRQILQTSYPFVRLILGAGAMGELPKQLLALYRGAQRVNAPSSASAPVAEGLPALRESRFQASVPVMYGCNNFCTYCIVPYVRGRERSRTPEAIVAEVRTLVAAGYREITLLGQNVNSYGKDLPEPVSFPALLQQLDAIPGDYWLRLMTSHPKDATPALIDTMLASQHIEWHLHLPVQSGSNAVLQAMNRRYTVEQYRALIDDTRAKSPDFAFSSDCIVGFPTETEADFQQTLALLRHVQYDNLFTFIYSPRPGTKAATLPPVATPAEVADRMQRLLALQRSITDACNPRFVGQSCRILVERYDADKARLLGRTRENRNVSLVGDASLVGQFVTVRLTASKSWALCGELLPAAPCL